MWVTSTAVSFLAKFFVPSRDGGIALERVRKTEIQLTLSTVTKAVNTFGILNQIHIPVCVCVSELSGGWG